MVPTGVWLHCESVVLAGTVPPLHPPPPLLLHTIQESMLRTSDFGRRGALLKHVRSWLITDVVRFWEVDVPFILCERVAGKQMASPALRRLVGYFRRWMMYHLRREPIPSKPGAWGSSEQNASAATELVAFGKICGSVSALPSVVACPLLAAPLTSHIPPVILDAGQGPAPSLHQQPAHEQLLVPGLG